MGIIEKSSNLSVVGLYIWMLNVFFFTSKETHIKFHAINCNFLDRDLTCVTEKNNNEKKGKKFLRSHFIIQTILIVLLTSCK